MGLRAAYVYPKNNILIKGQGKNTILKKCDVNSFTYLSLPSEQGCNFLYVNEPEKFYPNQGVNVGDKNFIANRTTLTKIEKIEKNKIFLKDPLLFPYENEAFISNNFPCIFVLDSDYVTIQDLVIDGNREKTPFISSWKIGGIKLWNSHYFLAKNIEIKNVCGDGILFGQSNYVILKNINSHHVDQIAIHLANYSRYAIVTNCKASFAGAKGNPDGAGILFCHGIKYCAVKDCITHDNKAGGINFGYKDSYNFVVNNRVFNNSDGGIKFRSDADETCQYNLFASNILYKNSSNFFLENYPNIQIFLKNKFKNSDTLEKIKNSPFQKMKQKKFIKMFDDLIDNNIVDSNVSDYNKDFPMLFEKIFNEFIESQSQ